MNINPKILGALMKQGGAAGDELKQISATYRADIQAIMDAGIPVHFAEREGKKFAVVDSLGGDPMLEMAASLPVLEVLAAPPGGSPPADAPPAQAPQPSPEPEKPQVEPGPEPEYDARITASDFKVKSRDGAVPTITITPEGPASAQAALLFSMHRKRGQTVDVYLRIRGAKTAAGQEPPQPSTTRPKPQEDPPVPIYEYECPKCHAAFEELQKLGAPPAKCPSCGAAGERVMSAPGKEIIQENERDPEKKSRAQLSREIDEQVRDNQLPPHLADAQARLAQL